MDPTPGRLVTQPPGLPPGFTCQQIAQNPSVVLSAPFPTGAQPNDYPCLPDTVAWANLMSELGMAVAPTAMHPARTTGYGGFALSLEAAFTHINSNAVAGGLQYWRAGTQGPSGPDPYIQVYSLHARKGLPYGLEVAATAGYVAKTTLWVWGADARWAVLEGYRSGFLGALPDIAVGGGVRTLSGASTFGLTTLGIEGELSKPFPFRDGPVLTPYLEAQRVVIFADSGAVDLTPSAADSEGTSFGRARIQRWRAIGGLDYRYEVLSLSAEFAMDMTAPSAENAGIGVSGDRQWTVSIAAGVVF
ncbi:MAG TPA: hypothetical protein VEK07_21675 [Polyangiaceae bacterium]|nr:hypothetical protein [Polyangiaceae bacterium]